MSILSSGRIGLTGTNVLDGGTQGAGPAVARLGPELWRSLTPASGSFISTALWQWRQHDGHPLLDYAPISVEIVKAVEVEVGRILDGFGPLVLDAPHDLPEEDTDGRSLIAFIEGDLVEADSWADGASPEEERTEGFATERRLAAVSEQSVEW